MFSIDSNETSNGHNFFFLFSVKCCPSHNFVVKFSTVNSNSYAFGYLAHYGTLNILCGRSFRLKGNYNANVKIFYRMKKKKKKIRIIDAIDAYRDERATYTEQFYRFIHDKLCDKIVNPVRIRKKK